MLTSCDVVSGPRGIGAVRSLCLLVIAFGLIILLASSYIDRYQMEICERRDRHLSDRRRGFVTGRRRPSRDDVGDDVDDAEMTADDYRELADAMDMKHDNQSSVELQLQLPVSSSNWDYDWDVYVSIYSRR